MSESGEYRCLAGNVLGETSSSIHLQINKSERARIHWTIFGLILFYAMAEKWAFVMIKIMKTSFLLKMAVAVTPLHSMLTSILSPLTVLLTTVVTPCLRTCDNVIMWHHYIQHTSYSYLSVEVHTRVCESSRKLKILVTVLRSLQNEKNEYTYLKW